jgi:hypothetical protein
LAIPRTCDALASIGVPEPVSDFIMMMSIHTVEEVNTKEARDRGLRSSLGVPIPEHKFIRQDNIRKGPLPLLAARGLEIELELCKSRPTKWIPINFLGFPQGSGISPIMFIFAFEHFALRPHFAQLHPSVKVVSYADDFLVFSDVPLPTVSDLPDTGGGLVINHEKSRPIKADGKFLVPKFKYLGVTFHTTDQILIEGTPRSGASLFFDKEAVVGKEHFRNQQIRRVINHFKDSGLFPKSPQAVIDDWGYGQFPSNLLPLAVVKGEAAVSQSLLSSLEKAIANDPNGSRAIPLIGGNELTSASLSARLGQAPHWLKSHLKGFWLSRLHGGRYNQDQEQAKRSIASLPKAGKRAWIDLATNTAQQYFLPKAAARVHSMLAKPLPPGWSDKLHSILHNLSIHNSTSYATVDLLNDLSKPRSIKIAKSRLRYSTK